MHPLIDGFDLNEEEMVNEISLLLDDPVKMAGFLMLLKAKGETEEEILGLVKAMRTKMKRLEVGFPTLDIVGTGGDQAGTVNISTGSALLAAECGVPVLKHGNRAVSSKCGSADVLEKLGFDIHADPLESLRKRNFGFCFAPDYHPAMAKVRPVRTALKSPTLFNLIGPLLNPAGIDHLIFGVHKPELVEKLARVLFLLGTKRSLVFSGCGIDELSCLGKTEAFLVTEKGMEKVVIDPEKLGLELCTMEELKGGDATVNAALLKNPPKAIRDTFILNAGVGLFLMGIAKTIQEGVKIARVKAALKRGVIAEIKRASPSKGKIGEIADPAERAKEYERAGAGIISVLTSPLFEGSLEDLTKVKEAVSIPVLRKDFITSVEELYKTKADLVLLIVSFLGEKTKSMLLEAKKLGLQAIVEVHTEAELKIALDAGADIIGINQRDLNDFTMHPESFDLIHQIPRGIFTIAESGVANAEDAKKRFEMGFDAILVGEALTRNAKLCEEICSLKSAV
ncbi:MAG: anthranilate phosphoribosyltransferase [Parachlamydiales bacterium]|nr:anthranilate phosphoribosyltransferase [Parachlamydiales bacterium]